MRKTLKFLLYSALVLFVGLPVAFVLFVVVMSLFGVVVGLGFGLLGLIMKAVKVALLVIIPLLLLFWLAKRLLAPERNY